MRYIFLKKMEGNESDTFCCSNLLIGWYSKYYFLLSLLNFKFSVLKWIYNKNVWFILNKHVRCYWIGSSNLQNSAGNQIKCELNQFGCAERFLSINWIQLFNDLDFIRENTFSFILMNLFTFVFKRWFECLINSGGQ